MSETYYLQDEITRLEDLVAGGLVAGDTIAMAGKILTCESNVVAEGITGLFATGTGTIRMLNGGNADFSGSNPLPSTITIEGGTEEKPLPSYGSFGYVGRSAACIKIKDNSTFAGTIISHCFGNWDRPQFAKVLSSTNTSITIDRDMDLEIGDEICVCYSYRIDRITRFVVTGFENNVISHTQNYSVPAGSFIGLATSGFCILGSGTGFGFSGQMLGDELLIFGSDNNQTNHLRNYIKIKRLVYQSDNYSGTPYPIYGRLFNNCTATIGTLISGSPITGMEQWNQTNINYINVYKCCVCHAMTEWGNPYSSPKGQKYILHGGGFPIGNIGTAVNSIYEYVDCELPNSLFDSISNTGEITVRTTSPKTAKIYRKNGTATLRQKSNFPSPAEIPEARQLEPNDQTCYAWHDEEQIIAPGRSLVLKWQCFISDENTESAGIQVLDGKYISFGRESVEMNIADVITEYKLPADSPVMQWLPVKQIAWQNTSDKPKKVILRGWCKGGQIYSRIGIAQGGVL